MEIEDLAHIAARKPTKYRFIMTILNESAHRSFQALEIVNPLAICKILNGFQLHDTQRSIATSKEIL